MNTLKNFTNLYQLSKTLRFELIPQGKTLEFIEKNGLLSQDEHRAESYKKVKKLIDEYHKKFIDEALSNCVVKYKSEDEKDSLEELFFYYKLPQQDEARKNNLPKIQENLRKQIVKAFTSDSRFTRLGKKELIKEDLLNFVVNADDKELVNEFKDFTTYFTGFHENRKNMYSAEEKSTAISYRLINENLPRFIDNMSVFEKVKASPINESFTKLQTELESIIQVVAIDDMFLLSAFNETLTQTDIDRYNHLIGGYTSDDGKTKIQGLNEYINLYNQKVSKNDRLPKFKPLYKQILSDRITASFIPEQFENDQNVLDSLVGFYAVIQSDIFLRKEDKERTLKELLEKLSEYDLNAIYLKNDTSLTNISKKLFGDWSAIQKAVENDFELNNPRKKNEKEEKYEERKTKYLKSFDSFSIGYLNQCVATLNLEKPTKIESYFSLLGKDEENNDDVFSIIEAQYNNVEQLLNTPYPESKNLSQQKHDVEKIKAFLDAFKELQWFIKPLLGKGDEADKDNSFYGEFTPMWDALDENLTPLYNKVRNYMTRKPYSTEKFKLNFESSYFLNGWSPDYETKAGLLFKKEGYYYLGVNNKKLTEDEKNKIKTTESNAKRIILDFQKPDNKNIPRLFIRSKGENFAPAVAKYDLPIQNIIEIYDSGKFKTEYRKKDELDYLNSLHKLIDYFKIGFSKHESYKHYKFGWKSTKEYKDIAEFYNDVEISCYQVKEEYTNWDALLELVDEGKLYLFKIYNKDFSPYSKGRSNLHTLYWKMLFDAENLKNVVYKLNGQAEVFFRKSKLDSTITHPKKYKIAKKFYKDKDGNMTRLDNNIVKKLNLYYQGKLQKKELNQNELKYIDNYSDFSNKEIEKGIIKNKRYTIDKFQFHVPITMNFKADTKMPTDKKFIYSFNKNINLKVKEKIVNDKNISIIGIDRGERHLLYLTLIDTQGKIKEQYSLNEIINTHEGTDYKINYHDLLDKKEGNRIEARKNWQTIETIKELKAGYLSQVIHKIVTLIIDHNAIVVLEDLNLGFKRGRQKVEKQVYQKFEQMLIDKLNYLVFKKSDIDSSGGLLHAYQLSGKYNVEVNDKLKQSGFLFYVPAWNTSKMDPVTGFVNLFDTRYENMEKSKAFFQKFDAIRFNEKKDYFEFSFDYNKFTTRAEETKTDWTVCTYGNRIENFRNPEQNNEWDSREFDLTEEMKSLFVKYGIDLHSDLKEAIEKQSEKSFFQNDSKDKNDKQKGLLQLFRFALQMRNSKIKSEVDYLISPVANEKGEFYDSRTASDSLPQNADGNGAYNIARKGLWVIEQIQNAEDLKKVKLAISNKEWLQFAQK